MVIHYVKELIMTKRYLDTFFEVLNQELQAPENSTFKFEVDDQEWSFSYLGRIIMRVTEVSNIQDEIKLLLDRLGVQSQGFLVKVLSVEELFIGLKFYLISWSTLKDVMANLINCVLDLGIDEKDLSFGQLLRNQKVKSTKIPDICKKYSKKINIGSTDGARNDAVHRGTLADVEVTNLKKKKNRIQSKRFSLLKLKPISEDEYKKLMNEFNKELSNLVASKREEYKNHFKQTMSLNEEIAIELAKVIMKQFKKERI